MFKDNSTSTTFKFMTTGNNKKKNNVRSSGNNTAPKSQKQQQQQAQQLPRTPNPLQQKGRVRVQAGAGDKCVPPAKSRPKKRKAVPGTTDGSGLSMDSVQWSDKQYSVNKLIQKYADQLPVIVKVTQGYYGEVGGELSIDQVSVLPLPTLRLSCLGLADYESIVFREMWGKNCLHSR